ncbi:hypothetical protein GYA49_03130 [Candidatus Beckwithbacteria bacterium]|nr:hypothetical protein [Candidatus Beckwithbacteria bacterium]
MLTMDTKALQLCAHFALQPNQLGYCGRDCAPAKFQKCMIAGDCKGVETEIKKFIVLNPYLQTIAEVTGLDPFSYQVIEAYWLGNDLLKKFKPKHYQILLKYLAKQGVPDWLLKEISKKQPKAFIPIHLFNILHVGVGRTSGSVPFNLKSINQCMIRWGVVSEKVKAKKLKLKVKTQSLRKTRNNYQLISKAEIVDWNKKLVSDIHTGDQVAVHWGWVAKKLNKQEIENLQLWTEKLVKSI